MDKHGSFLKRIFDKYLKEYKTPESVINYVNKEKSKIDFLLINPPYDTTRNSKQSNPRYN